MSVKIEKDGDVLYVYPQGMYSKDKQEAELNVAEVQAAFFSNGFNVTDEAVMHNYDAWCSEKKSGYLDDERDYFLFTPCGSNQLRFSAERINGEDYQRTYKF